MYIQESNPTMQPPLPARSYSNDSTSDDSVLAVRANLSRHVSSVISHFTSNKEGYQRLLTELDDCLYVLNPTGVILFAAPSVTKCLQKEATELVGSNLASHLHPDDVFTAQRHFKQCVHEKVMVLHNCT